MDRFESGGSRQRWVGDDELRNWREAYPNDWGDRESRADAFFARWRERVRCGEMFWRSDLRELLRYPVRHDAAFAELIRKSCDRSLIAEEDARWMVAEFEEGSYARSQLEALLALHDPTLDWRECLMRCANLNAPWAAVRCLRGAPIDEIEEGLDLVRGKKNSRALRDLILERMRHEAARRR